MRNVRARCHSRASLIAVFTTTGTRLCQPEVDLDASDASDARRRNSSGCITPSGVTIQTSPRMRLSPLAHPAVLTHAAIGPCWPAVVVGRTRIAPADSMVEERYIQERRAPAVGVSPAAASATRHQEAAGVRR